MKFKSFKSIAIFSVILVLLSSCLNTNDSEVIYSDNACFVSLKLAKDDTVSAAVFTLIPDVSTIALYDSIIVNVDSLPYTTDVDSVYPTFKFNSSAATFVFYNGSIKDSIYLDGTDTLNFTKKVKVRNYAADKKSYKDYQVKVNVHTVDPELYIWSNVIHELDANNAITQKAVFLNNKFYYFLNNGSVTTLYTSIDGILWNTAVTVEGLPSDVKLGNMQVYNNKLNLILDGTKIATSIDGLIWTAIDYSLENYVFKSFLFSLNGSLWAIVQSTLDEKIFRFASSIDGATNWLVKGELPEGFPITDFTSISFTSRTGLEKALAIGGKDLNGNVLRTNWNTENGTYWIDFSIENESLDTLALGSSIILYDNKLLMFGESVNSYNHLRESLDEGFSWIKPSALKDSLPIDYQVRSYQSALVNSSNRIFLIGGKESSTVFSDVWTGKLNKKKFIVQ